MQTSRPVDKKISTKKIEKKIQEQNVGFIHFLINYHDALMHW